MMKETEFDPLPMSDERSPLVVRPGKASAEEGSPPDAERTDQNERTDRLSSRDKSPFETTKRYRKLAGIAVILFLSVAFLVQVSHMIPTEEESSLAARYDIPILRAAGTIRSAQKIADQAYLSSFMGRTPPQYFHALKKIEKKDLAPSHPPRGCEATVVIVRHCEKGSVREHCTYAGFERSVYLATLFGDDNSTRWPAPSYIYAEAPHRSRKKMNFREMETVGPVSEKVHVPVDYDYSTGNINKMAREILIKLQTGELCGRVVLVAWKHSVFGHLARQLGCGPLQGCPYDYRGRDFDVTWQIKFVYREYGHSHRKDLEIPPGLSWGVYGVVTPEGFDALAFSKMMGDYPRGGTKWGGRWKDDAYEFPERKHKHDWKTWEKLEAQGVLQG